MLTIFGFYFFNAGWNNTSGNGLHLQSSLGLAHGLVTKRSTHSAILLGHGTDRMISGSSAGGF